MSEEFTFTMRVGEREPFGPMKIAGPAVRVAVTVEAGCSPLVRRHVREALQRALVTLFAYEGPGKLRSVSTHAEIDPYPLPEEFGGA